MHSTLNKHFMIRNNWTKEEIQEIYELPLLELVYRAATVHRAYNNTAEVQVCTLLSVKTGGCPEDCSYCPQAARYHTDVEVQKLLDVDTRSEEHTSELQSPCNLVCR